MPRKRRTGLLVGHIRWLQVVGNLERHVANRLALQDDGPCDPALDRLLRFLLFFDRGNGRTLNHPNLYGIGQRFGDRDLKRVESRELNVIRHRCADVRRLRLRVEQRCDRRRQPSRTTSRLHRNLDRPPSERPRRSERSARDERRVWIGIAFRLHTLDRLLIGEHFDRGCCEDRDLSGLTLDVQRFEQRQRQVLLLLRRVERDMPNHVELDRSVPLHVEHDSQHRLSVLGLDRVLLDLRRADDAVDHHLVGHTQLQLKQARTFDRVTHRRQRSEFIVEELQLGDVIHQHTRFHRFRSQLQLDLRRIELVSQRMGTTNHFRDFGLFDACQPCEFFDIQQQVSFLRHDKLPTLTHDVQRMNARRWNVVVQPDDIKCLGRCGPFGVNFERQRFLGTAEQLDRDDLPIRLIRSLPTFDVRIVRRHAEDAVPLRDGDSQLSQLTAQHVIPQERIGVDQAVSHRHLRVIRDAGEQIHLRLDARLGMPQHADATRRAEVADDLRFFALRFNRLPHEQRSDLNRLIRFRNQQFKLRDADGRDIEIKTLAVRR